MARFILLHHFYDKGKLTLALYDRKKNYFFTIPWWKYRQSIVWYTEQGVTKGERYEQES